MRTLVSTLLMAASLAASMLLLPVVGAETGLESPASAKLLSFKRDYQQLNFEVISTGCTSVDDFVLQTIESQITNTAVEPIRTVKVELIRNTPDPCRRIPRAMTISIAVPDNWLAETTVIVNNPFTQLTKIKRI